MGTVPFSKMQGASDLGGYTPDQMMSFDINTAEYNAAMSYADDYEKNTPNWSLKNNCTDFALTTASKANINIPKVKTLGWSDPNKLSTWIESKK